MKHQIVSKTKKRKTCRIVPTVFAAEENFIGEQKNKIVVVHDH